MTRRTALVTGASSGIGHAIAHDLAGRGYDLVVLARRQERLQELATDLHARHGVETTAVVTDLADPATPDRVCDDLEKSGIAIDILVANAGNSHVGAFGELPWSVHAERLQLMGVSTMQLAHRLVGPMAERGWGRIIVVSSIGAHFSGFPGDTTYGAVKSMMLDFAAGLDAEYRPSGVRCTVSVPGPTATEIFTHEASAADVGARALFRRFVMKPEFVARKTCAAGLAGRPWVAPGASNRALIFLLDHAPRGVRRRLSRALCNLMGE